MSSLSLWFKKYKGRLIFLGIVLIYIIAASNNSASQEANQEVDIYQPQPISSPKVLDTPAPNAPTNQAPVYYNNGSKYKYNSRSGYSGGYEYNYDIEGYGGEDGDYYYGDIDISQDGGEGYLYDDDGNEIWIEGEWDGYGVIEAYDEDGNYYELEVE